MTQFSRELQADGATAEPTDRRRWFLETGFLENGVVGSFLETDDDLFVGDFDGPLGVDESTKDRLGSGVAEALQMVRETLVEHRGHHGQGKVEVHVQADFTAKTIEVEEGDLRAQKMFHMVAPGVCFNHSSSRQTLRKVVG